MGFQTTVREWFRTGLRPDEPQFFSFFAMIFWKDEKIPIESIEGIEEILNDKAEAAVLNYHLDNPEAHAIQFDSKENKNKKGVAGGYAPLDGFGRLTIDYLKYVNDLTTGGIDAVLTAEQGKALRDQIITINTALDTLLVNDLTTGGTTKALTAEQGKQLKIQINAINTLLTSDNVNLDTLQELVDAIETVQLSLSTILVNDLTTGGTTKALTAEMGKSLKALIDSLSTNKVDKAAGERLINASEITKLSGLANVTTTVKTIVSTALASQDLAGFVAYINALAVVLVVGANEIVEYKTSDTGRVFKLLLRGRSFGTGQPAITTADAIETTEWMNKDIRLSNYPNTRNDGQIPTNKVLSADANGNLKMYSIATAPAPYLYELIPDSYLPNTTGMFVLKGAFFTTTMTVAITGQTVNYVTFISDNEVRANVTTGSAEGGFNVILNNGLTATFVGRMLVVLGDAYEPMPSDYIGLTSDIDGTEQGNLYTLNYAKSTAATVQLDKTNPKLSIAYNQNFAIRFEIACPQENGSKAIDYTPYTEVKVLRQTDNSHVASVVPHTTGYDQQKFYINGAQVLWGNEFQTGIVDNSLATYKYRWGHTYEIRRIGTTIEYRVDNVVRHTATGVTLTDDLYVAISMMPYHIINIKVIKLIM